MSSPDCPCAGLVLQCDEAYPGRFHEESDLLLQARRYTDEPHAVDVVIRDAPYA